ncbi:uncharacterized protein LY89DRAFT_208058 [Mollisia scopiformis]|uniref:ferric-chelate reductase (NADPH) n=1 Tax=Mollisia scopiformis TaxID=149040 RepID=A0A194WXQ6_MOLSC|nr:uncharacterized protein LY89DRAFT_208058 [Mollisia scopiformis]KUJ12464.1 hypothetical protein LY89DRAFT_208058 [Mollisia scopiformis]
MMLPWLDDPVMLHSSRADTCKLTAAQCEYRSGYWRYWYQADHVYGHATVYFMCAVIGVFMISNIISKVSKRSASGNSIVQRGLAATRLLAYKTFHVRGLGWYSPPLGVILLGLCGVIYFFSLTLGPKPYYWPNTKTLSYGGSPPIATRSGWMALGLLPFVMLLSQKTNYITLLTGISHEKLQVYHRWTSWTMFVLALVHTFPFIVVHIQKGDMVMQWDVEVTYWTGVAAIITQAWLNIMSIGPIRNRYYEFFKATHYLAIGFFIFFFFIHCDFRLTSWDYFIAALSLYAFTLIVSFLRTSIQSLDLHALFLTLPDGTLKITIPTKVCWAPGQHVFLRFWALGLHAYTTHPFTICSLPDSGEMVFYMKPQGGFTARLKSLVQSQKGWMPMSVDGPYGDTDTASTLASHEKPLIIAGGSGVGYLLGVLRGVLKEAGRAKDIKAIIAVRHSSSASWILETVESILSETKSGVSVELHITDSVPVEPSSSSDDIEKVASRTSLPISSSHAGITIIQGQGRPDLKELIRGVTSEGSGSVGVAACGPSGMMSDVGNSCAEAQGRILRGGKGPRSVWLHTEAFSW